MNFNRSLRRDLILFLSVLNEKRRRRSKMFLRKWLEVSFFYGSIFLTEVSLMVGSNPNPSDHQKKILPTIKDTSDHLRGKKLRCRKLLIVLCLPSTYDLWIAPPLVVWQRMMCRCFVPIILQHLFYGMLVMCVAEITLYIGSPCAQLYLPFTRELILAVASSYVFRTVLRSWFCEFT